MATTTNAQALAVSVIDQLITHLQSVRGHAENGHWNLVLAGGLDAHDKTGHMPELGATMAREAGASWAAIGKEMGMSRQAAEQRFGDFTRGFLWED